MKNCKTISDLNKKIINCEKCQRLVEFRNKIALEKRKQYKQEKYWGKPITGYGDLKARLPKPTGWRVLVMPYKRKEKTKKGIILPENALEKERVATVCAYVLEVGPDAYGDKERFPEGPWCQKGDWVIFARYAGSRLKIDGGDLRLLNDDEILAIIQDPTDILHM